MAEVRLVEDLSFEELVLKSDLPVLVDFWATWCGPCRHMAPIMDQVADIYAGKVHVVKMDVDENLRVSEIYGIRSIPTFVLFKNGQVVGTVVGGVPQLTITNMIDKHI